MLNQKLLFTIIAGVVVIAGLVFLTSPEASAPLGPAPAAPNAYDIGPSGAVGCTEEAMLCPDGSSVGRMPPTCEFAPCPNGTGTQQPGMYQPEVPAWQQQGSM